MNTVQNYKNEYQISQWLPSPAAPIQQGPQIFSSEYAPQLQKWVDIIHEGLKVPRGSM